MKEYYTFLTDRDVNGIKTQCKNVDVCFLCDKKDETCQSVVDGNCHCFDCYHTANGKHKIKKAKRFFEIMYFKDNVILFEGDIDTLNFIRSVKDSLEAKKDDIIFVSKELEGTYDDLEKFHKSFDERLLHRGRYKWGGDDAK